MLEDTYLKELTLFWFVYWTYGITLSIILDKYDVRKMYNLEKLLKNLLINMIFSYIFVYLLSFIPIRIFENCHDFIKILISLTIGETLFYHIHIMMHQNQLYPLLHKKHHEFTKPFALSALYGTIYEMCILNTLSFAFGPIITQLKGNWLYIWVTIVSINAVTTHSGIDNTSDHDIHHSKFNYNYGTLNFWDHLYGTYY